MTRASQRARFALSIEGLLWITAALSLGTCSIIAAQEHLAKNEAAHINPVAASPVTTRISIGGARPPMHHVMDGSVIARLEIPALHLSVPVTTGIEPSSLLHGVGHVNGTAMPGGLGNLGLAGHRDTYLRALKDVTPGMDVRVVDATGIYHYTVDSMEVVTPEQVQVLDIRSRPELTLITCFPFNYIGAAPKRFIVHAHLNSVAPDGQG